MCVCVRACVCVCVYSCVCSGQVLASCHFVGGPQIERFERHFAEYIGVAECVALNTGYDALYLAFKLLGVGPGDEVRRAASSCCAALARCAPLLRGCRRHNSIVCA